MAVNLNPLVFNLSTKITSPSHVPDVVQRRDLGEVLEVFLLVGVAVVGAPGVPDGELVEAQHVHHAGKERERNTR